MSTLASVLLFLCCQGASPADSLEARLTPLVKAHKGKVAIAIKNLKTGERYDLHADEVMPTASLIKFPVMIEVYQQVAEGKVKLSDMVTLHDADKVPGSGILTYHFSDGATFPLRDAVRLMIAYSDNTATNLILDRIGIPSTGKRMQAWGFPNTRINAKVFRGSTTSIDPPRTKKYGLGSTTARETLDLLERLYQGKLVSPAASKEMIAHLKQCQDRDKLCHFLPKKIVVAHKSGSVSAVKTDAGILYLPGGPLAVVVLTAGNADRRFEEDNEASVFIGRVAEAVYRHFAPAPAGKGPSPLPPGGSP
jgi:beta-lactamase class A